MTDAIGDDGHDATAAASHAGRADSVTSLDAESLLSGKSHRAGADLHPNALGDQHAVIPGDPASAHPAAPVGPNGMKLAADDVALHAARGEVATARPTTANDVIGHAVKVDGHVTVIRNGVSIVLNDGDVVFKGDVVQTGHDGSAGLVFNDGSAFEIAHDSGLALSQFTYTRGASSNLEVFSLLQGAFGFASGDIAKTGDMRVGALDATVKIIAAAGGAEIASGNGRASVYMFHQNDGEHDVVVLDRRTATPSRRLLSSEGHMVPRRRRGHRSLSPTSNPSRTLAH